MMAEVSDHKRKLKSIVSALQRIVECPVCLEMVKTPFKVCARGHAACLECITKLQKCLLCQEAYILDNLVCVKSMLEALPRFCHYSDDGCEEVLEPGDDHEMFCGYRPIVCRLDCSEKMPLIKFLDHHENQHPEWYLRKEYSTTECWDLKPDKKVFYYTPVCLFNNLFWILEINDVKEKQLKIYFQATPIGKLEHDYYVRVKFEEKSKFGTESNSESEPLVYTYTLKACVLSNCENKFSWEEKAQEELDLSSGQYCMKIPQSELSNFTNDDGQLEYEYVFFRK